MTKRLPLIAAVLALGFALPAAAVRVTPAHSGSWFDPAYDKQGFAIEVLDKAGNGPERNVAVYWYTFDDDGAPVWAVGVGQTDGNVIELTLARTFGGARPPAQVPADDLQDWAEIRFEFGNCHTATAEFEMIDSGETGEYELQRLTQIGATTCTGGMSDEVPPDAEPVTLVAQLQAAAGSAAGAGGTVKFQLRPAHSSLEVDVRNIAVGDYTLRVGGEDKGDFSVARRGNGNGAAMGSIVFVSPAGDDQLLLDFDPRGQTIEVVDGEGTVALSVAFPSAH